MFYHPGLLIRCYIMIRLNTLWWGGVGNTLYQDILPHSMPLGGSTESRIYNMKQGFDVSVLYLGDCLRFFGHMQLKSGSFTPQSNTFKLSFSTTPDISS